jgi:hypothetical protein
LMAQWLPLDRSVARYTTPHCPSPNTLPT